VRYTKKRVNEMIKEHICYSCGQIKSTSESDPQCPKCGKHMECRETPNEGDFLIPLKKRGQKRMFKGFGVP
jgi:predicted RNA-binding Zn-ribbon protein involved in translation (DUF1610 family)